MQVKRDCIHNKQELLASDRNSPQLLLALTMIISVRTLSLSQKQLKTIRHLDDYSLLERWQLHHAFNNYIQCKLKCKQVTAIIILVATACND